MRIAVDLMGSDTPCDHLHEGAVSAANDLSDQCEIVVLVTQSGLDLITNRHERIEYLVADEEVLMHEAPLWVVRKKQNSTMLRGIKLLKEKNVDAFVSSGNTGAMTAYSSLELEKLPGITRPALLTELPTQRGRAAILDVGANVTYKPESFFEYALLGSAYQKVRKREPHPKIGLLNIGVEVRKGTQKLQAAYQYFDQRRPLLEQKGLQFEGNVEARDLFHGDIDVLVTDGFTGNVFLKTCEGVSSFILEEISRRARLTQGKIQQNRFFDLEKYLDYAEYPGALLVGLEGVVIKCHGSSSALAMYNGIKGAFNSVKTQLVPEIKKHLQTYLGPSN